MAVPVRRVWGLILAGGLASGCHGGRLVAPPPSPPVGSIAVELPAVTPSPIEPALAALPTIDPDTVDHGSLFIAATASFRGLTEVQCRELAANNATVANLLNAENDRPTVVQIHKNDCSSSATEVLREARVYAAQDARNRAAADALDRYFQLADAEARSALLVEGLRAFDQFREELVKLRAAGLPAPADDDLARQRMQLLANAEQAEAGIKLLNLDLKTRLGLPTKGNDRLWPVGDFGVPAGATDTEAAVQFALENRPDLLMLRTLYHGLSLETLPAARDLLRGVNGLLGAPGGSPTRLLRLLAAAQGRSTPEDQAEVETRRQQLFELIAEREKLAATEVRAAAVSLDVAERRVALAAARVQSWKAKLDDLQAKDARPAELLPTEVEWYKARGELVAEVMNWHRARVQFTRVVGGEFPLVKRRRHDDRK
jgi:hypothetical protein